MTNQHTTCGRLTPAAPSNPSEAVALSNAETRLLDTNRPLLHTHDRTLLEPVVEAVSGGQLVHWELLLALYVVENVLVAQLSHADDDEAAKVPALHALQVMSFDAPSAGDAVPKGHSTHTASPSHGKTCPCDTFPRRARF